MSIYGLIFAPRLWEGAVTRAIALLSMLRSFISDFEVPVEVSNSQIWYFLPIRGS